VLGSICASWRIAPGQATVTLSGTEGELRLDYGTLALTRHPADGSAPQRLEVVEGDRFVRQATHFLAVVRGVEPPQVTAADGVAACDVLARAYRSVAPIAAAAVSDGAAADGV
jgi:predicted dehydrogenase